MSLRQSLLCDHPDCNNPAVTTCPMCKRDCCRLHASERYIAVMVVLGKPEVSDASRIGQSPRITLCAECGAHLLDASVTFNYTGPTPLDAFVAPLKDELLEAATALLAERKLSKKK